MRYSALALLRGALAAHRNWPPAWRSPEPKAAYEVVIVVTVAGPRAWRWLEKCGLDSRLAPSAMRHMTMRESVLDGVPLRVLRASFSGELGYEVNLPSDQASAFFERLWDHHEGVGGTLYGIEALQVLRIEKGYLHVGTDTDGTTLPQDVGLARGIERKAEDFVGRRSLLRPVALEAMAVATLRYFTPGGAACARPPAASRR